MNKLKLWNSSIFSRLIIMFLLINIPLYIFGINLYQWAANTVKVEITNSAMSQLDFYLGNLERDFDRIKLLQNNLLIDEDLNQLAYVPDSLDDIQKMKALLRLQQRLISIKNSNPYIQEVGVYIPSISKTVYAANGVSDLSSNKFNLLRKNLGNLSSNISYIQNQILLLNRKITMSSKMENQPSFITEIQLSNRDLIRELTQSEDYKNSGLILMENQGEFSLSTPADHKIIDEFKEYIQKDSNKGFKDELTVKIDGENYMMIYSTSEHLNMSLYKYIPENQIFKKLESYKAWFWIYIITAIVIIFIFSLSTYQLIKKPMNKLVRSFKKVEEGDLSIQIEHEHNDDMKYVYSSFNLMVNKLKQLLEQVYMLKILSQRAELKQLQAQINPHFLYNSFFILYNMIDYDDNSEVKKFAQQLGNYFQYITRSAADEVPLYKEVEHARTYANIQTKRFRNRICLEFEDLPQKFENLIVPRLIIQPVIENAFEHGLEHKMEKGVVLVKFAQINNFFEISIEDNGEGMTDRDIEELRSRMYCNDEELECTGIINIHKRIKLKFGAKSGVTISRGSLGGLKVSIQIGLEEESCNV